MTSISQKNTTPNFPKTIGGLCDTLLSASAPPSYTIQSQRRFLSRHQCLTNLPIKIMQFCKMANDEVASKHRKRFTFLHYVSQAHASTLATSYGHTTESSSSPCKVCRICRWIQVNSEASAFGQNPVNLAQPS